MKKVVCVLLALMVMMLGLVGCGEEQSKTPDVPAGEGCLSFVYNGVTMTIHGEAAAAVSALGEPKSFTEETSCAFEGLDKTYYYGGFYLETYPQGDKDRISSVWFADDSVTTAEGICIGDDEAKVKQAYGEKAYNGANAYEVVKGASKLTVLLTDGAVSSVQYTAIFE